MILRIAALTFFFFSTIKNLCYMAVDAPVKENTVRKPTSNPVGHRGSVRPTSSHMNERGLYPAVGRIKWLQKKKEEDMCLSQGSGSSLEELIEQLFGEPDQTRPTVSRCDTIGGPLTKSRGHLGGCYDCYNCDHQDLIGRNPQDIEKLTLNTESCDRSHELCCVTQPVLHTRSGGICGAANRDGSPPALRKSAREVLPAQYPWTAALYRETEPKAEYLCGAALVSPGALVTTARCVSTVATYKLLVKLGPSGADHDVAFHVEEIVPHEEYSSAGKNDIALLVLSDSTQAMLPKWAIPVCLPTEPTLPGTSCVIATNKKKTLYSRVVTRNSCSEVLQRGSVELHTTQMCSLSDLPTAPQHAAPLVCEDEMNYEWVLRGLASFRGNLVDGLHLYTDIFSLTGWLQSKMKEFDVL